jgi:hypothetical protein
MPTNKWMTVAAFVAASAFALTAHARPGSRTRGAMMAKRPAVKSSAPKSAGPTAKTLKASKPVKSSGAKAKPAKAKATKALKTNATTTTLGSKKTTTTSTSGSGTWTPNNPVAQKLSTRTRILGRVTNSLPPNTDLNAATAGFKNFGQFVAAVNVSNNLGIPFADLKTAMTGTTLSGTTTGTPTLSLGQAIQQLKSGVNADIEAAKAQTLAEREIVTTPTRKATTTAHNTGKGSRAR